MVQEAIKKQDENPKSAQIAVEVNKTEGVKIVVTENGAEKIEVIGFDC